MRRVVRREDWGDPPALVARARRHFGAPSPYGRLALRGLPHTIVREDGVRGEWIGPGGAPGAAATGVLLYVHGGGYVSCSAASHRPVTAGLARRGVRVFSVDYRIAPEATFPAAIDDVVLAYRWLVERGAPGVPVSVAGESAGGGLVLALATLARDGGMRAPACVMALSPWTDLTGSSPSVQGNDGRCAMFRPRNMSDFATVYLGEASPTDPRASPAFANLSGLPPVLLQVGSTELLLDDARRVHDAIGRAGGESRLSVFDDTAHGWHLMTPWVPEANAALDEIVTWHRRWSVA